MAIQTRGFGVQVMPQYTPVNANLAGYAPAQILGGALDSFKVAQAYNALRAQMDEANERKQLRPDRLAATKAGYSGVVRQEAEGQATSAGRVGAENVRNRSVIDIAPAQTAFDKASLESKTQDISDKEAKRPLVNEVENLALENQKSDLQFEGRIKELVQNTEAAKAEIESAISEETAKFYRENPSASTMDLTVNLVKNKSLLKRIESLAESEDEINKLTLERDIAQLKAEKAIAEQTTETGVRPSSGVITPRMAYDRRQAEIAADIGLSIETVQNLYNTKGGVEIIAKLRRNNSSNSRFQIPLTKNEKEALDAASGGAVDRSSSTAPAASGGKLRYDAKTGQLIK